MGSHLLNASENLKPITSSQYSVAYSKPCQASKVELFVKTVGDFQPLPFSVKSSILDARQSSSYAPITYISRIQN